MHLSRQTAKNKQTDCPHFMLETNAKSELRNLIDHILVIKSFTLFLNPFSRFLIRDTCGFWIKHSQRHARCAAHPAVRRASGRMNAVFTAVNLRKIGLT
jgi:hypothetical protein